MSGLQVNLFNLGMIFYVMLAKTLLWHIAKEDDPDFMKYLKRRASGLHSRNILYLMMDPDPNKRHEMNDILQDSWVSQIVMCDVDHTHSDHHNHVASV